MTEQDSLLGFYGSFGFDDPNTEKVRSYLWGENGLDGKLKSIKPDTFGKDFDLILFQVYSNPVSELRDNLKEIESYRKKEKSIGISIVLDDTNFFHLDEQARQVFLVDVILEKLDRLKEVVARRRLDLDVNQLKQQVEQLLK